MEKKNKGLIVAVILLTICVISLAGYIVYEKFMKEDTIQKNDDNKTIEKISCSDCVTSVENLYDKKDSLKKNILFDNKIKELTYEANADNYRVLIDNTEIYNQTQAYSIESIYIFEGETIMIVTSGVGIGSKSYYVFNKNLNKVDVDLAIENGDMMEENIQVDNKRIIIDGSRYRGDGSSMIYNGQIIDLCANDSFIGQDYLDVELKAEYEVNYLGKSEFSKPIKTKTLSVVNDSICH